jgi:hypothetical protein
MKTFWILWFSLLFTIGVAGFIYSIRDWLKGEDDKPEPLGDYYNSFERDYKLLRGKWTS